MLPSFTVYTVPDDPPNRREENLGSKDKFWCDRDGEEWLFKAARSGSGDDWAEVVAEACADLLGLPHAHYELAVWRGQVGVVSMKIHGADEALIFGNQLLAEMDPNYPAGSGSHFVRTREYTIEAVAQAVGQDDVHLPAGWSAPAGVTTAVDVFAGYLLLDAWIGNTDRHHLNWGVVESLGAHGRSLAPTFDHAASLGSGLLDNERWRRLTSRNPQQRVQAFVKRPRVRSPLFGNPGDAKSLSPLDAFLRWRPLAGGVDTWLNQVSEIAEASIAGQLQRVPASRMSEAARLFVMEVLTCNRRRILEETR